MKNKTVKRASMKAWGVLDKRDGTLYRFCMPVKDIEYFYTLVENTKKHQVHKKEYLKIVPVVVTYQIKAPRGKRK